MSAEEFNRIVNKNPDKVLAIRADDLKELLEDTARRASQEAARQTAVYFLQDKMISRQEAKKYLNVSNNTFTNWENKGILKARSTVGNKYLYSLDDVMRLAGKKSG